MKNRVAFFFIHFLFIHFIIGQTPYDHHFESTPSFNEDFSYSDISDPNFTNNWIIGSCYGTRMRLKDGQFHSGESQFYHDDNVLFTKEGLVLEARERTGWVCKPSWNKEIWSDQPPAPDDTCWTTKYEYTSGRITSQEEYQYGKFEANIRIPKGSEPNIGSPYWPAFWLIGCHPDDTGPEIDIFEFGKYTTDPYFTIHDWNVKPHYSCGTHSSTDTDYSSDFHKYSLVWLPDRIVWYINDEEVKTLFAYEPGYRHGPVRINLNLAVSYPYPPFNIPASLDIQYVKVHKLKPSYPFNSFEKIWCNNILGNDDIENDPTDAWINDDNDMFLSGKFTQSSKDNLLCINRFSKTVQIRSLYVDDVDVWPPGTTVEKYPYWSLNWSNYNGGSKSSSFSNQWKINTTDKFVVGNFDPFDSKEELLCIGTMPSAKLLSFSNNSNWTSLWDGEAIGDQWYLNENDTYLAGNFSGTISIPQDELLCINPNGWAKTLKFENGIWLQVWSNGGKNKMESWNMNASDNYLTGNFDDSTPHDEVLCINQCLKWAKVIKFDPLKNTWIEEWSNGGNDKIGSDKGFWTLMHHDNQHVMDIDGDGADEIIFFNSLNKWSKVMKYDGEQWNQIWSNGGKFELNNFKFHVGLLDHHPVAIVPGDYHDFPNTPLNREELFAVVNNKAATCPEFQNYLLERPTDLGSFPGDNEQDYEKIAEKSLDPSLIPNPVKDRVIVDLKKQITVLTVTIVDAGGRIVEKSQFRNRGMIRLNTTDYMKGIYFIQIKTPNSSHTLKMIKL